MYLQEYGQRVEDLIREVAVTQFPVLGEVAKMVLAKAEAGGRCWFFGSGHSHILAEEMQYSELVPDYIRVFNPPELFDHPSKSGIMERNAEFASVFLDQIDAAPGDVFWIISNSGTNGALVEMALWLKEMGCTVVTLCNLRQTRIVTARHPCGKKLADIADYVIDNCGQNGDAAFEVLPGKRMGATSNIVGAYLLNAFLVLLSGSEKLEAGEMGYEKMSGIMSYDAMYRENLQWIRQTQMSVIEKAAALAADCLVEGKNSYMLGFLHDHSLVEEIHARAGTIMCNKSLVMTNQEITFYHGIRKAEAFSRCPAYAKALFAVLPEQKEDCFLLVSRTADEPAMVEFARMVKKRHGKVVLLTALSCARQRQEGGSVLDYADVVMDNGGVSDGFPVTAEGIRTSFTTSAGAFILQCYIMAMAWEMNERGVDLPVRISINTDNGLVYTEGLNKKYFNQTII